MSKFIGALKSFFHEQDMTVGNTVSCLLKFSIPMLIGNIAQLLYSTADAAVVGRYVGDAALGAVGASGPIQNLFVVFLMAVGGGVTVMVSQYFGAKDTENLSISIGNTFTLLIILSVVMTAISVPLTTPILKLTKTSADMFDMSHSYLLILFWGTAAVGFYNVTSGILRGLGDSFFPLIVLLVAVIINVFLDIWMVAPPDKLHIGPLVGLDWGISGAAIATVTSQIFSATACTVRLLRMKHLFQVTRKTMRLKSVTVQNITRLGLPTGIQMAIMFLSNLVMQPFIMQMNTPTLNVFAAMTATQRVDSFAVMPCQSFSQTASTFTGQNIGANNMERVKKGTRATLIMSLVFTVVMLAAVLIFGRYIFELFTETKELIDMSMGFIYIMIPAYILMAVNMTYNGVMRGAGDTVGTMWISVLTNVILKVPVTLLLIKITVSDKWPGGNPDANFWGLLICMVLGCAVTLLYYRFAKWREKSIITSGTDV
ncbi:MAG: MATE family efflux transporter [Oscillospiraceae bacterium]|jgi:putative MATE family efflux protein|nr:MATE family efflux transporter [Oscillospiraceae bacterium]